MKEEGNKSFLLVAPVYAISAKQGGGQRTNLIFRALKQLGQVDILLVGGGDAEYYKAFFEGARDLEVLVDSRPQDRWPWRYFKSINPNLVRVISTAVSSRKSIYTNTNVVKKFKNKAHDAVVGRYLRPLAQSGYLDNCSAPILLDIDDRDDMVLEARANKPGTNILASLLCKWHAYQIRNLMKGLLPKCSHVWVTNNEDYEKVHHQNISVLPNIPYIKQGEPLTAFAQPENHTSKVILFVGTFGHRVNYDAIERFVTKIWPKIKSSCENAIFRVVGVGGWESVKDKFETIPGVEILGFQDSLENAYQDAALTVVPIFEGGGTKIKVLESLLYQRASVVTNFIQAGYKELEHHESLMVAQDEQSLVEYCVELLEDSQLRANLAKKGHNKVIEKYTFEHFSNVVNSAVQKVSS